MQNSADFATLLSLGYVGEGAHGAACGAPAGWNWCSANPKDMTAVRHEFGHTYGGSHYNNDPKRGYHHGYEKAKSILGGNHINYFSNPRIMHPTLGFPIGTVTMNDMSRFITEKRFLMSNQGDESKPCFTCNAYSGVVREAFIKKNHFLIDISQ